MKNVFNKIKVVLTSFWMALISFPFKALSIQTFYWIPSTQEYRVKSLPAPVEPATTIVDTIIKIAPRLLVVITFIVWIVNLIKIRKIDDKSLKINKIKGMVYIMIILIILIITAFRLSDRLLRWCTTCWRGL